MTMAAATATLEGRGLAQCRSCGLLMRARRRTGRAECPRCNQLLPLSAARTRTTSLATTTALLAAAAVLYIPSNLLPIMITRSALGDRADTILSGAKLLYDDGSWPLALVIVLASVLVPLMKLGVLGYLVLAVRFGWPGSRPRRTAMYRLIEVVGRWSMLDVFVVALLAALVQLAPAAQVSAGPGVLAFGAVVWLTLWATQTFDPRLIWLEPDNGKKPDG